MGLIPWVDGNTGIPPSPTTEIKSQSFLYSRKEILGKYITSAVFLGLIQLLCIILFAFLISLLCPPQYLPIKASISLQTTLVILRVMNVRTSLIWSVSKLNSLLSVTWRTVPALYGASINSTCYCPWHEWPYQPNMVFFATWTTMPSR